MTTWSAPRTRVMAKAMSALAVVVLMPPAHEPGDPPIYMSASRMSRAALVMPAMSTVLNPAVRAVTDWNAAAMRLVPGLPFMLPP